MINKKATKFIRGSIWCQSGKDFRTGNVFEVPYRNIVFPSEVDKENPNKRNFATQSIELIEAKRNGNTVTVQFKHTNNDTQVYPFTIKSGTVYDDQGNQLQLDGLSFVNQNERLDFRRRHYDCLLYTSDAADE